MTESWRLQDTGQALDGETAVSVVRSRIAMGDLETWFESDSGRLIALVTNRERAMVMLLREVGDAGEHVVNPSAQRSTSRGYVLSNGQVDTFPD